MPEQSAVLILAAKDGQSVSPRRVNARREVLMKPLLSWVLDACAGLSGAPIGVVVGSDDCSDLLFSGAAACPPGGVSSLLEGFRSRGVRDVLVVDADLPLLSSKTLLAALAAHRAGGDPLTLLTTGPAHPQADAGCCWLSLDLLISLLPQPNGPDGAFFVDVTELLNRSTCSAGAFVCPDAAELARPDGPAGLAALNALARERVLARLYAAGVDIPLTDGVLVGPDVVVGRGTLILPGCILSGRTTVGEGCVLGPNAIVVGCRVGDDSVIDSCRLADSAVGSKVRMGPYSQLRPGSVVADGAKIGNFVEIKNSSVGAKTSLAHLTYIGDSDLGAGINVGCGVVTVNYDGRNKHRTVIRDGAFIGCNANLIAPVTVGEGAYVAAASTITEDVRPDALAIGRVRAAQKDGWAAARRASK